MYIIIFIDIKHNDKSFVSGSQFHVLFDKGRCFLALNINTKMVLSFLGLNLFMIHNYILSCIQTPLKLFTILHAMTFQGLPSIF